MVVPKNLRPSLGPSNTPKLHALLVAAHPDDAEISLGGTILRMVDAGHAVGIVDLTRGELGSRGTIECGLIDTHE